VFSEIRATNFKSWARVEPDGAAVTAEGADGDESTIPTTGEK
jgi:hypothetical protein